MDELQKHYAKWKKPVKGTYNSTFMKFWKIQKQINGLIADPGAKGLRGNILIVKGAQGTL